MCIRDRVLASFGIQTASKKGDGTMKMDPAKVAAANGSAGTGASNATRGLWMGCSGSKVDYITIATTGTAKEFGDANVAETYLGCMASPTRALQGTGASATNTIVYYNIATTGNYTDFGDQTAGRAQDTGTSNAHGGLG